MPDYKWTNYKNAGYLHDSTNKDIQEKMDHDGFMIAGNEWQNFRKDSDNDSKKGGNNNHLNLDAVFATSFRNPVDRALSQFRLECVEDRGCKIKTIEEWWPRRNDCHFFADKLPLYIFKWFNDTSADEREKTLSC